MNDNEKDEKIPFGQKLFDNVFFWLAVGVGLSLVFYLGWGILEILTIPDMPSSMMMGVK